MPFMLWSQFTHLMLERPIWNRQSVTVKMESNRCSSTDICKACKDWKHNTQKQIRDCAVKQKTGTSDSVTKLPIQQKHLYRAKKK